jgi:hypothetical protein
MWTPFAARRAREQRLLDMLERLTLAQTEALAGLTTVLQTYLKSFETDGPPRTWTNDDASEARMERERLLNDPHPLPANWPSMEMDRLQFMLNDLDG